MRFVYGKQDMPTWERCQEVSFLIANGLGGYLPTRAAVEGGSYSAKPASTICGPDGGDVLVEKTLSVLNQLWR